MIEVIFEDRFGDERVLAVAHNDEEANEIISAFLEAKNYKSFYWRYWKNQNGDTMVDVGSHSEFFILREV